MRNICNVDPNGKTQKKKSSKRTRKLRRQAGGWARRIALTVLVICVSIVCWSVAVLTTDEISLTAVITPVEDGYLLTYPLLDISVSGDEAYDVGDVLHLDERGFIARRGVAVVIDSVERQDDTARLTCSFQTKGIPTHLTVDEYRELFESSDMTVAGRIVSCLTITGKIVAGRFTQSSARLS